MNQSIVIGLLVGTISMAQATKLSQITSKYEFDPVDVNLDHHMSRYIDAATGKYKTEKEYAEAAKELDPNNIYKPLYPFHAEEDTGHKYATSHRCFGKQCPMEAAKSGKYTMRPKFGSMMQTGNV